MTQLSDEQINHLFDTRVGEQTICRPWHFYDFKVFARAIESAAAAPLLARIAEQAMQLVSAQAQAQENHERAERWQYRFDRITSMHWVESEATFRLDLNGTDDAGEYKRQLIAAIDAMKGQP